MTIRVVRATVTVAPPDAYGTPTTFTAGQILDIAPGSAWETAIGAGHVRLYVQGQDDVGHSALSN